MTLPDEIVSLFKANAESKDGFEPLKFLNESKILLQKACSKGGSCDPLGTNALEGQIAYRAASDNLFKNRFAWAAEQLLFEWWNDLGLRQREEKNHVYRAYTAYLLMMMYFEQGDKGATVRWAMLTQADDILSGHGKGGGIGKQMLRSTLGMSEAELDEFNATVTQNMKIIQEDDAIGWANPEGFAENAIVRFALSKSEFAHLFAQDSTIQEYPLSSAYYSALLQRVDDLAADTTSKGAALEDLASYLFLLIPGWVPRRNVLEEDRAFETDVVVSNLNRVSNLYAELLGRHFLVECKNWIDSVGVRDVGYFLYRMRLTHARFGVMLAKAGITGSENKAARSLIRRAFHEDGNICVVLDHDDLDLLAKGSSTFSSMILARIEQNRFGKPQAM